MKSIVAAAMLLSVSFASFSQSLSIFGFELGKALTLAECPYKAIGTTKLYDQLPVNTCISDAHPLDGYGQPVRPITFGRDEIPPIVKNWTLFPLETNGILVGVHFLTPGVGAQDVVLAQLKQKYGEPSTVATHAIQNSMGARFDAVTATWELGKLRVSFDGVGPKLTYGEVYIDLPEGTALRAKWQQNARANERKL